LSATWSGRESGERCSVLVEGVRCDYFSDTDEMAVNPEENRARRERHAKHLAEERSRSASRPGIAEPQSYSLRLEPLGSFVDDPGPELEVLAKPYLLAESLTLVQGAPGALKTWLLLHLGVTAAAAGHQVVYVTEEGRRSFVAQRLRGLTAPNPHAYDANFAVVHMQGVRLDDDRWLTVLGQKLLETAARVVLFDPLSDLHGGDESEQRHMAHVREALKALRTATRAALVLAVHTRKGAWDPEAGAQPSLADARGSGVLAGAADLMLDLRRRPRGDARDPQVLVEVVKTKDLPELPDRQLFTVHTEAGVTSCTLEDASDAQRQRESERLATLGRKVLQHLPVEGVARNELARQVGGRRADVLAAIRQLVATGQLIEGKHGRVSRHRAGSGNQAGTSGTPVPSTDLVTSLVPGSHPLRGEPEPEPSRGLEQLGSISGGNYQHPDGRRATPPSRPTKAVKQLTALNGAAHLEDT
jgi:KaiC/GvpD/RAD55 family RecA-like ATPase